MTSKEYDKAIQVTRLSTVMALIKDIYFNDESQKRLAKIKADLYEYWVEKCQEVELEEV